MHLNCASIFHVDSCTEIVYYITSHTILCDAIQDVNQYLIGRIEEN